ASRAQLEAVYEGLAPEWQAAIQRQGDRSREELLQRHHQAVANGGTAVIFGLASFAEGADLPGAACRSVVIAKLPFAVPTSPVEATRAEWVADRGGKPFFEIALPDASLKLIQAVGRLIRAEDDYGIVALLDNRLHTKGYGRDLLRALPDFTRDDEGSAV
ncbi:MAG: helicase C-terminal domain-containing protein, partial [Thiohalorhabdaceae bacterium]